MAARKPSRPQARRILLGESLRIESARETFALFAAVEGGDVDIDASRVARVDAAGLQALLAGVRRLAACGATCRWRDVPATLASAAALCGLATELGLK